MALFVCCCIDKPGCADVRQAARAAHLDYLKGFADRVLLGGPLLDPESQGMVGSLLVIDLPDLAAAYDWVANDPYGQAGLFESVLVRPFKKVLPLSKS